MIRHLVRKSIDGLDAVGMRPAIAAMATATTRILGRDNRFSVDSDGDWVNRQPSATFVSPDPLFSHLPAKQAEIVDLWCHQHVPAPGEVIVDVGAGIGDEAVVFSRMVGQAGHIYAIEAHPHTFRCLQKTIERSGLTNVTAIQCAIADAPGTLLIEDSDAQNHISHSVVKSSDRGIEVPAYSLDGFVEKLGLDRIDLLKMNIEGAERLAVRGMSASHPMIGHFAISCHDFVADRDGPAADDLRTREDILAFLKSLDLDIAQRLDDPRPWVRDYVYARNLQFAS